VSSGSFDRTIKLWNTKTRECLRTLTGHGGYVVSVSFDGEGLGLLMERSSKLDPGR